MKKKIFALALALVMALSLAACGGGNGGGEAASTGGETAGADTSSGPKIGVVVMNAAADTYMTTHYNTMESYAKELGVSLTQLDRVGDGTRQANQVRDLIEMGVDVIGIWAANSETAVASAKKANEAGIPVVAINTPMAAEADEYIVGFVGPDNFTESNLAAQQMVADLGGEGNIVVIEGQSGRDNSTERLNGMLAALEGTNITVLDSQVGEYNHEESRNIMENYLTKYPSGQIIAVYCMDDTECLGAVDALESAGRLDEVAVYGAALGDWGAIEYVQDGSIDGMAIQSPVIDAKTSLDYLVKVANGEEVPEKLFIETPVGTPENIDSLGLVEW